MAAAYELSMGLGGTRAAGDLVARMVFKGMKLTEAKEYVAGKLGCAVEDLADCYKMKEIRESLDIGHIIITPHSSYGMAAKIKIAELLDIRIPSVENFKETNRQIRLQEVSVADCREDLYSVAEITRNTCCFARYHYVEFFDGSRRWKIII